YARSSPSCASPPAATWRTCDSASSRVADRRFDRRRHRFDPAVSAASFLRERTEGGDVLIHTEAVQELVRARLQDAARRAEWKRRDLEGARSSDPAVNDTVGSAARGLACAGVASSLL